MVSLCLFMRASPSVDGEFLEEKDTCSFAFPACSTVSGTQLQVISQFHNAFSPFSCMKAQERGKDKYSNVFYSDPLPESRMG